MSLSDFAHKVNETSQWLLLPAWFERLKLSGGELPSFCCLETLCRTLQDCQLLYT